MAKPNYAYEKRQRELAKKKKKEEKALRKSTAPQGGEAGAPGEEGVEPIDSAPDNGADAPPPEPQVG